MKIRQYDPADREAVLALVPRLLIGRPEWRDAQAWESTARGWVRAALDSLDSADDEHAVFVAEADTGEIAGFVDVGHYRHFIGEMDAYVGELAVSEAHLRTGVGRALVAAAEEWAGQQGYDRLALHAGNANVGAMEFYRALGFEPETTYFSRAVGEL